MVTLPDTIAAIRDTPIEDIRRRIDESRHMSSAQVEQRQRTHRRARAAQAAAALRSEPGMGTTHDHPTTHTAQTQPDLRPLSRPGEAADAPGVLPPPQV